MEAAERTDSALYTLLLDWKKAKIIRRDTFPQALTTTLRRFGLPTTFTRIIDSIVATLLGRNQGAWQDGV